MKLCRSSSKPFLFVTGVSQSPHGSKMLVISGGDGYEDFGNTGSDDSVGREDSTNHLLLWQI